MDMDQQQVVFVIDDDAGIRDGLQLLLETTGQTVQVYANARDFLADFTPSMNGCLLLDIRMPNMSGLELQTHLNDLQSTLPIIFISGHGDIPMAVEAMRQGALDFIRKPFREQDLLERINQALLIASNLHQQQRMAGELQSKLALLSERERQIFTRVANGDMNKVIASDLGISERTVEVHRSQLMKKLKIKTLAQLVRCKLQEEQMH
jgi:FixJ family two-component response regulator